MAIPTAVTPVAEIFELRWKVLRPGLPEETAVFPEDSAPGTFHIAAYDGSRAVRACVTFFPEPLPGSGGRTPAHRFRGMASDPSVRGRGFGRAVLAAGIAEARSRGAGAVWCHGRTGARGFYEREGFTVVGEEFEIEGVGPHVVLTRALGDGAD
ncbi:MULTISPECIES: GNAT family N-acetyltransferase [Streptomyces]|uniref:GNAT family N-acetyltransferase n=2 Tax=Streptomyces TaxID=1883 RepID=A0A420V988_9ACTN|nr:MULTISPECIES: GNAT family N-acetyltransferase [Streptomyces]KNE79450.1 GNAT family acetyltransferase [Streptomyces fradiae]OFA59512.1 GNAT family N-acetyltransferase [Streptomyces fradiae]PQM24824.1 N-acetyltransferase [Streptomyces xinghaiensis]RKM98876.1 GNAT family N-acetyltransferase [Streptomyces xinghaiensis]RNC76222.1 GNAT family N-acetyltransferase [Streptomyces xinghaiensis]